MEKLPQLYAALAKAQSNFKTPKKTMKVNFVDKNGRPVKYNYADLADVIECTKQALGDNGLSVSHCLGVQNESFGITTHLFHSEGGVISTWYPIVDPRDVKPQEFGSAITYARRYSLSALLGIASEEDDDGQEAKAPNDQDTSKNKVPPIGGVSASTIKPNAKHPADLAPGEMPDINPDNNPTIAQLKRLFAIATDRHWSNEDVKNYVKARWPKIDSTKNLTRWQYDNLVSTIETESFKDAYEGLLHSFKDNIDFR